MMNDLPEEWIQHADELGPHGKPLPPETWTPEREAAVARWRDELMAAGEKRDRERIEIMRPSLMKLSSHKTSAAAFGIKYGLDTVEVRYWLDAFEFIEGRPSERPLDRKEQKRRRVESWCNIIRTRLSEGIAMPEIAREIDLSLAQTYEVYRKHNQRSTCTDPSIPSSTSAPTPSTSSQDS